MQKCCLYILCLMVVFVWSCGGDSEGLVGDAQHNEDADSAIAALDAYLAARPEARWDSAGTMPDDGCIKIRLNYPGPSLRQLFNDSNYMHYAAASQLGIEPIVDDSTAMNIRRPLQRVMSDRYIYVDSLRYSLPYLVPESRALLYEVAQRFHDTLQARGGGNYRLKVTSFLRTKGTVRGLRRVNRASVDSSAHLFGTTFDISFKTFPYGGGTPHRTQEDMKNLLAEILYGLHQQGRCYVKYEHRQGCFHITARP